VVSVWVRSKWIFFCSLLEARSVKPITFFINLFAQGVLISYLMCEASDFMRRWRSLGMMSFNQSKKEALINGVFHGVVYTIGFFVGGMRANLAGAILLFCVITIGTTIGAFLQWLTPLKSIVGGRDR
jgi:hypothetical protein